MPDLPEDRFAALRGGEPELPVLPAVDVRRRGDRLRRTRRLATGLTGGLAVVAVAGGVLALAPGERRSAPDPADTPTSSATATALPTTIPADAPLAAGLPATNEDGTRVRVTASPGAEPVVACNSSILGTGDAVDVAGVAYAGGEDYRSRTLVLLASEEAAQDYIDQTAQVVAECSPRTLEGGADEIIEPLPENLGSGSAAFRTRFENPGSPLTGPTTYHLARVANAVLIVSANGETSNTPEGLAGAAEHDREEAAEVLAALTDVP